MTSSDLVQVLTPSLGQDKAKIAVGVALKNLGWTSARDLSYDEAREVLDEVGKEGGLVAAAAKVAGLRLDSKPRT